MNTSTGCTLPSRSRLVSSKKTIGISAPRYCTTSPPLQRSISATSNSSSRVISDSGTAFNIGVPRGTPAATSPSLPCLLVTQRILRAPRHASTAAIAAGQSVRIDDHDHAAVAENGVAGEHPDIAQQARHRLDHDLFGMEHAVDKHAKRLAPDLHHHNRQRVAGHAARASGFSVFELEQLGEVEQRQQLVAQAEHRRRR